MKQRTVLSINLNKIAVLRNSRGGDRPSVIQAADVSIAAGCGGITVHPRPDQRHIRPHDVLALADCVRGRVEFNIEGNPFAPPREGYPGLLALVEQTRPSQVTLVPDTDGQLTSDHGFDLARDAERLAPLIKEFKATGARVSLFMDADAKDLHTAGQIGADRIEIYTGPYAQAHADGRWKVALERCADCARRATATGLKVNAGHDLSQSNLADFLRGVPQVAEVSIGHAVFDEALYDGLSRTVSNYVRIIEGAG